MTLTIYTTEPISPQLKKSGLEAARYLGEDVVWKRVKAPEKVTSRIASDGYRKIDPLWLRAFLKDPGLCAFHFTPMRRRKWQLAPQINGNAAKVAGTPIFYICANPAARAKGYPFSEVTRLILHERLHAKTSVKNVHDSDYKDHGIHILAERFRN